MRAWLTLLGLAFGGAVVLSSIVPDPIGAGFTNPSLARLEFWFMPCAIVGFIAFLVAPFASLKYLITRKPVWVARAVALSELSLLFLILGVVTGTLFSWSQTGKWWHWDPVLTSLLLCALMQAGMFTLRESHDPDRRASFGAVYSIASWMPLLPLLFVFQSLTADSSMHPVGTVPWSFRVPTDTVLALLLLICVTIYKLRVRLLLTDTALEGLHAELADCDHSSAARLVRSFHLSESDRSEGA